MKTFVLICLSALVVAAAAEDVVPLKDVNLEELLADEARRKLIFDCLLDQAPCGEYQTYRDAIPDLVKSKCEKCTPEEKAAFEEKNKYLLEHFPAEYQTIVQKFEEKPAQ